MDVIRGYYDAMRHKSADELAELYAEDAVHEFPFRMDGMPEALHGREQIRAAYTATWGASPFDVTDVRDVVVHRGLDPEVFVSEHTVVGTVAGQVLSVPGLLVLRVRDGLIVHNRDYMDATAVTRIRQAA
ncbi:nuclear transport factor 2 family protein [Nonomuraea soli]|uniref:Ketosteroid isomerase-like protein n=1 Tax=Nonomuraea soli TaxID=1032476 RepID=A0A7W0HQ92_9ACTN|nr:nuclear transport factor 2 family protein [Nonomuraea soli]MBA2891577.1 ketosteroid isomerase-like protein [Nonomuraea soli]